MPRAVESRDVLTPAFYNPEVGMLFRNTHRRGDLVCVATTDCEGIDYCVTEPGRICLVSFRHQQSVRDDFASSKHPRATGEARGRRRPARVPQRMDNGPVQPETGPPAFAGT
jgi:hypothetical protein